MTIASVDAINMYLSIKISTIRKSVRFFARKITAATKKKSTYDWNSSASE